MASGIIGKKLEHILKQNDMSQTELAERTSLKPTTIYRIIHGYSDASLETLLKITKVIPGTFEQVIDDRIAEEKERKIYSARRRNLSKRWINMKDRCLNKNTRFADRYCDRGITVCKEWIDSFEAFLEWSFANGYNENLTLDRIDNDREYSPENCRWTTWAEQNRNKSNTVFFEWKGRKMVLKDWCTHLGLTYHVVKYRIKRGETIPEALGLSGASWLR